MLEVVPEAGFNVLHVCGPRIPFPLVSDLDPHAVSWSVHEPGAPSLPEGRALSDRAVISVDHVGTMVRGTPADVAAEARAALEHVDGPGLLLAPGCSVPAEAPEDNLWALSAAGKG